MPARDLYSDMVEKNREDDAKHDRIMGYLLTINVVLFTAVCIAFIIS